jgi:hypothetical protein
MYPNAKNGGIRVAPVYGIGSFSFEVKWRKII